MSRIRVAVLFGGRSSEHEISCVSAAGVLSALDPQEFDVVPVGITKAGDWVEVDTSSTSLSIGAGGELPSITGGNELLLAPSGGLVSRRAGEVLAEVDVVLPLLHGPYGEDGTVQGMLEMAGVPYVGSGVFASAAAMDKSHMKVMLAGAGLPVGPWLVVRPGQPLDPDEVAALGWPVFVKPARGGSSVGISKVTRPEDLDAALALAREHDPKVVIEAGVPGREVECGVLAGVDGAPAEASLPAEITLAEGYDFYDFQAKYLDGATKVDLPADLSPEVTTALQEMALQAFAALDCEGLARIDFFVQSDGVLVVNEVNTMPGFTPTSMFPQMWAASGVDYPTLVGRLVRTGLKRGSGLR